MSKESSSIIVPALFVATVSVLLFLHAAGWSFEPKSQDQYHWMTMARARDWSQGLFPMTSLAFSGLTTKELVSAGLAQLVLGVLAALGLFFATKWRGSPSWQSVTAVLAVLATPGIAQALMPGNWDTQAIAMAGLCWGLAFACKAAKYRENGENSKQVASWACWLFVMVMLALCWGSWPLVAALSVIPALPGFFAVVIVSCSLLGSVVAMPWIWDKLFYYTSSQGPYSAVLEQQPTDIHWFLASHSFLIVVTIVSAWYAVKDQDWKTVLLAVVTSLIAALGLASTRFLPFAIPFAALSSAKAFPVHRNGCLVWLALCVLPMALFSLPSGWPAVLNENAAECAGLAAHKNSGLPLYSYWDEAYALEWSSQLKAWWTDIGAPHALANFSGWAVLTSRSNSIAEADYAALWQTKPLAECGNAKLYLVG